MSLNGSHKIERFAKCSYKEAYQQIENQRINLDNLTLVDFIGHEQYVWA